MKRFTRKNTSLEGVIVIDRMPVIDARGYFERMFCAAEFREIGLDKPLVQINHSKSRMRGTVRGMHFQYAPHAEIKIVSCLRGAVWDVAVDLRAGSPTFLQWHAEVLSEDSHRTLVIPEGFAHGFQSLTDDSELVYLTTAEYAPQAESGINPRDPRLGIRWPFAIAEISERDDKRAFLEADFQGVTL